MTAVRQRVVSPEFVRRYPFYVSILSRLEFVESSAIDAMAVSLQTSGRMRLHVNMAFFGAHPEFVPGVLHHELQHVALGHLTHEKFRSVPHPDLMVIAKEISANEFIREALPGDPVRWEAYAKYGIRSGQSTLQRYRLLERARRAGHKIHTPNGHCCATLAGADPAPLAAPARPARPPISLINIDVSDLLSGFGDPGTAPRDDLLGLHEDGEALPAAAAAIEAFIRRLRGPARTYAWPNRRFPNRVGEIPGRRTSAHSRFSRVLAAVDTSGSMSEPELSTIARHLRAVSRLVRLIVVECDAVVQRVYPFQGSITDVRGRGGTDLRPVFDRAFLARQRPAGVIYFTDGQGATPNRPPAAVRTLWVLTKPGPFACKWGERARLYEPNFNAD